MPKVQKLILFEPVATSENRRTEFSWLHPSLLAKLPVEKCSAIDQVDECLADDTDGEGYRVVCFRAVDFEDSATVLAENVEELIRTRESTVAIGLVDLKRLSQDRTNYNRRMFLFSEAAIERISPLLLELVFSNAQTSTRHDQSPFPEVQSRDAEDLSLEDETSSAAAPSGLSNASSESVIEQVVTDVDEQADTAELIGEPLRSITTDLESENRSAFISRIESEFSSAGSFAVYIVRFQRLHHVRERFGPDAIQHIRQELQSRLLGALRASDSVSQLGTSTFGVLCPSIQTQDEVELVGARLSETISEPYEHREDIVMLRPAIGFAASDDHGESAEQMVREATRASAFAHGSADESQTRSHRTASESTTTLDLAEQIKLGLDRDQFELHFQPIVSIDEGRIVGFEGLCRWYHPESGEISPGRFIPIAEKTGLIFELDRWVVKQGLAELRSWSDRLEFQPFLTLNISRPSISQPTFGKWLCDLFDPSHEFRERLILELTESAVLERHKIAEQNLKQMQNLGMRIALDDFGAGYSSFSALKNLPIDILKIDRSFVSELFDPDSKVAPLVKAIAQTAEALDLGFVAEGIETREELEFFEQIGSEYVQGFLFAESHHSDDLPDLCDRFSLET